ncbi:MAG: peptidase M19 [Akkermansiaceae bacterium]|nr:peptidase M19 [Akkermansiaceae bacterium]NNM28457.1 peptidase M19 [Akkermansiaceae bacterium]
MRWLVWFLGLTRWTARFGVWAFDDGLRNRADVEGAYAASPEAEALHGSLRVADGHADSLMYERGNGFLAGSRRGHVDVARLLKGRVGLQVLTVVTRASGGLAPPFGAQPDALKIIAKGQGWPVETWESPRARAMHQAAKWRRWTEDDRIVALRERDDLEAFLQDGSGGRVALLLGLEGCHAMEGLHAGSSAGEVAAEVSAFRREGFRLMGVHHQFDNVFGPSSEGDAVAAGRDGGLSPVGELLVQELERQEVLIDVAHSSPAVVDDILRLTKRPLVSSHTGVVAHTPNGRNLGDAHVRAIARRGGVIGIGYWKEAVGDRSVKSIVDAMEVTAGLLRGEEGVDDPYDHIGIGSDFDGAVNTGFNADGHVLVTDELLRRGHDAGVIRRVMGANLVRVVKAGLPGRG